MCLANSFRAKSVAVENRYTVQVVYMLNTHIVQMQKYYT